MTEYATGVVCPACGEWCNSYYWLTTHIDVDHTRNATRWECFCGAVHNTRWDFERHLQGAGDLKVHYVIGELRKAAST